MVLPFDLVAAGISLPRLAGSLHFTYIVYRLFTVAWHRHDVHTDIVLTDLRSEDNSMVFARFRSVRFPTAIYHAFFSRQMGSGDHALVTGAFVIPLAFRVGSIVSNHFGCSTEERQTQQYSVLASDVYHGTAHTITNSLGVFDATTSIPKKFFHSYPISPTPLDPFQCPSIPQISLFVNR